MIGRSALLLLLWGWTTGAGAADISVTLDRPAQQGGIVIGHANADVTHLSLNGEPIKRDSKGDFLLGFGRDAPSPAMLQIQRASGEVETMSLMIPPRHYALEIVNGLPPRTITLSPADQKRRVQEVAAIAAAREMETDLTGWREAFIWPVHGPIGGVYGSARIRNGVEGTPHNGVDLKARTGTAVKAPASGVVRLAVRDFLLEGGLIILDHGHGLYSDFLHLSRIDVHAGDAVQQSQILGAVGATGRATGPHLHWGLKWHEARLDPQLLIPTLP